MEFWQSRFQYYLAKNQSQESPRWNDESITSGHHGGDDVVCTKSVAIIL